MSHNLPNRVHTFTSTATRLGHYWIVQCDQHPGVRSKVRLLAHAIEQQRHGIASAIGTPERQVVVEVNPVLPESVLEHIARARELRATATWANSAAAAEMRAAARALAEAELSLRDIGTILGVSHQRAHQLIRCMPADDPHDLERAR